MEDRNTRFYELLEAYDRDDENERKQIIEEIRGWNEPKIVAALIYVLRNDEHYYNRSSAADILGELGDRQAIPPLIEAFKGTTWAHAVAALAKFNDPSLIEPMILSMNTRVVGLGHGQAVESVLRIILSFGEPAFQAMLRYLNDPALSSQIAHGLGISQDRRAVEPLIKLLNDLKAGPTAANSLAEISDPSAVEPLIRLLKTGPSDQHREAAARALGKLKDPRGFEALEETISDPKQSDSVRSIAATALGQAGKAAIPDLLKALADQSIQYGAASGLAVTGQTKPLIQALRNENNQVRAGAADALGLVGSSFIGARVGTARAPVEPLIEALKDEDSTVRESAIRGILNIAMETGITSMLFSEMRQMPPGTPPEMAAMLRGQVNSLNRESLIDPMLDCLQDANPTIRMYAAMVLGHLKVKNPITLKALKDALADTDENVRFRANEALIWMGATPEELKDL